MNNLIIMVGLVGSGKSTLAQTYKSNMALRMDGDTEIISSDEIRKEVFGDVNTQEHNAEVFSIARKRLKENIVKKNVIIDATNITIKNRRGFLNTVDKIPCKKIALIMTTPFNLCKKWNANRERVVPEEVLESQIRRFQIPFYEEGFDDIAFAGWSGTNFVDFKVGWDLKTDPIFKSMIGFDQKNSHHIYTLDKHCIKLASEISLKYPNNKPMIRAAFLHDLGKLYTGEPKNDGSGNWSYKGHMNYGTYTLLQNLDCLGFNNIHDILECLFFINYHMEPFFWLDTDGKTGKQFITNKTKGKMMKIYGEEKYEQLLFFNKCDKIASGTDRD